MPLRIMSASAVLVTLVVFSYVGGAFSSFTEPYVVSDIHRAAVPASGSSVATKAVAPPAAPAQRIATLAPAISQMLVDMGKGKQIVGVGEFDASAPHGLPVVGTYTDINTEALLATKPSLVFHMSGKEGPPAALLELANSGIKVMSFPSPSTIGEIADILSNTKNDPSLESTFKDGSAAKVRVKMMAQLDAIRRLTATRPRLSTLLVIGTNPLMASGPKTVFSELVEVAGGSNAAAQSPVGAPTYDREGILGLAPQAVLLLLPGAPALKSVEEDSRLGEFKGLNVPAVTDKRIYLLNDALVQLPASNVSRVAAKMAKALHPELAQAIDRIMSDPSIGAPMGDPNKKGSDSPATRAQTGGGPATVGFDAPRPKKSNSDNPATRAQYIQ